MKHASNRNAWAIGTQKRNGFHVRRVVWGMLMASVERRPDEEIRKALAGNLCMCTGYVQIVDAVKDAAKGIKNG